MDDILMLLEQLGWRSAGPELVHELDRALETAQERLVASGPEAAPYWRDVYRRLQAEIARQEELALAEALELRDELTSRLDTWLAASPGGGW